MAREEPAVYRNARYEARLERLETGFADMFIALQNMHTAMEFLRLSLVPPEQVWHTETAH